MSDEAGAIDRRVVPRSTRFCLHDRLGGEGDHCDRGHDWIVESMDVLGCDLALATRQFAG
jgi:hypothetical protein